MAKKLENAQLQFLWEMKLVHSRLYESFDGSIDLFNHFCDQIRSVNDVSFGSPTFFENFTSCLWWGVLGLENDLIRFSD